MLKHAGFNFSSGNTAELAEAAVAASRQTWLAALGAAAITRKWTRDELRTTFRTLVKHGSAVERQAISALGDQIETGIAGATSLLQVARRAALTAANEIAATASAMLPGIRVAVRRPTKKNASKLSKRRSARKVRTPARGKRAVRTTR